MLYTTEQIYQLFRDYPKITTDSRAIESGSIFFALHGPSFDGNNYALDAIEKGAAYAVVDRADIALQSDKLLLVSDTLEMLQSLARHHRQELNIPIVAITGSNGKTTTKELVAAALSSQYRVYATRGNLNNHIGVPLTLLSMDSSVEIGVVEMGASAQGEIALLCSIAEPNYGVITNIGRAHLEGFGGEEGIRCGKGELFEWLSRSEGTAFVPSDDDVIVEIANRYQSLKVISYSYSLADGVKSQLEGEYNLKNIATALSIASKMGVSRIFAHEAIARYNPTNNRSQLIEGESNTIIADCYNANPSSMEAAISNFIGRAFDDCSRGKIFILGDMLELGEWSSAEHIRVIEHALSSEAESIWLVGKEFKASYDMMDTKDVRVVLFPSISELLSFVEQAKPTLYAILVKGSHSIGLEKIIQVIT